MGIDNTTLKECVITATINMEEPRNHGIVHTTNSMPTECAKTATLTPITAKEEKKETTRNKKDKCKVNSKLNNNLHDCRCALYNHFGVFNSPYLFLDSP